MWLVWSDGLYGMPNPRGRVGNDALCIIEADLDDPILERGCRTRVKTGVVRHRTHDGGPALPLRGPDTRQRGRSFVEQGGQGKGAHVEKCCAFGVRGTHHLPLSGNRLQVALDLMRGVQGLEPSECVEVLLHDSPFLGLRLAQGLGLALEVIGAAVSVETVSVVRPRFLDGSDVGCFWGRSHDALLGLGLNDRALSGGDGGGRGGSLEGWGGQAGLGDALGLGDTLGAPCPVGWLRPGGRARDPLGRPLHDAVIAHGDVVAVGTLEAVHGRCAGVARFVAGPGALDICFREAVGVRASELALEATLLMVDGLEAVAPGGLHHEPVCPHILFDGIVHDGALVLSGGRLLVAFTISVHAGHRAAFGWGERNVGLAMGSPPYVIIHDVRYICSLFVLPCDGCTAASYNRSICRPQGLRTCSAMWCSRHNQTTCRWASGPV